MDGKNIECISQSRGRFDGSVAAEVGRSNMLERFLYGSAKSTATAHVLFDERLRVNVLAKRHN